MANEGQDKGGTAPQEATVDSMAPHFAALLSEEYPEDTQSDEDQPTQEAPESESKGEDQPEDESEETSEESDEQSEEPETPALDQSAKVKLTIDGQEVEVTLEEALKGYSRTQDYTRKTQALAEERKKFQTEEQAVRAERAKYATDLKALQDVIKAYTPQEPDWNELAAKVTPQEFQKTWAAWQTHKEQLKQVEDERKAADAKVAEDTAKARQEWAISERDKLIAAVPEWKDKEVAKKDRTAMVAYATEKCGFSIEDLNSADSRALVMLRKAMLWDQAQAKKPGVVTELQKKVKVATPGAATPQTRQPQKKVVEARERLRKDGRVEDAGRVFASLLPDNE